MTGPRDRLGVSESLPPMPTNHTASRAQIAGSCGHAGRIKKISSVFRLRKRRLSVKYRHANDNNGHKMIKTKIDPDAVYTRKNVAAILERRQETFSRWAKRHGLKFSQRRGGYITGRALLDWIDNRNAAAN